MTLILRVSLAAFIVYTFTNNACNAREDDYLDGEDFGLTQPSEFPFMIPQPSVPLPPMLPPYYPQESSLPMIVPQPQEQQSQSLPLALLKRLFGSSGISSLPSWYPNQYPSNSRPELMQIAQAALTVVDNLAQNFRVKRVKDLVAIGRQMYKLSYDIEFCRRNRYGQCKSQRRRSKISCIATLASGRSSIRILGSSCS